MKDDIRALPSTVWIADHSVDAPTQLEADGAPTWITRSHRMVIAITKAKSGTRLVVTENPDEHMVLLPDAPAVVSSSGASSSSSGSAATVAASAGSLVVVPPGNSEIVCEAPGLVVRAFTTRQSDLTERAANAAAFAAEAPDIRPLSDGPDPIGGYRLRVYDLQAALTEGDKTRVFRSTNLMINILRERHAPRDTAAMSPHSHDDFEQASVTLRGAHIHHMRHPWTPDMAQWKPDEAVAVGAPSVTVIPPKVIHTTRNIGSEPALLIDFFAPPRDDFARRPGMVRNAADYPTPFDA